MPCGLVPDRLDDRLIQGLRLGPDLLFPLYCQELLTILVELEDLRLDCLSLLGGPSTFDFRAALSSLRRSSGRSSAFTSSSLHLPFLMASTRSQPSLQYTAFPLETERAREDARRQRARVGVLSGLSRNPPGPFYHKGDRSCSARRRAWRLGIVGGRDLNDFLVLVDAHITAVGEQCAVFPAGLLTFRIGPAEDRVHDDPALDGGVARLDGNSRVLV